MRSYDVTLRSPEHQITLYGVPAKSKADAGSVALNMAMVPRDKNGAPNDDWQVEILGAWKVEETKATGKAE